MNILIVIVNMIWLMLPAYLANPAAAISAKIKGLDTPVDFGKCIGNERILGDGKTYKGFVTGGIFGILIGLAQNNINEFVFSNTMPVFPFRALLALSFGAMTGDLIASFFKRRLGIKRGQSFFPVDQLDFVAGSWIFTLLIAPDWFLKHFTLPIIVTAIILTPILHRLVNIIGYKIGVSRHPW